MENNNCTNFEKELAKCLFVTLKEFELNWKNQIKEKTKEQSK